jgi:hypothetical protein
MLLSKIVSAVASGIEDGIDEIAPIPIAHANIVHHAEIVGFLMDASLTFLLNGSGVRVRL